MVLFEVVKPFPDFASLGAVPDNELGPAFVGLGNALTSFRMARKAAKAVSFLRLPSRRAGTGSNPAKREKDLLPLGFGRSRFLSRQAGFEMTRSSIVWNTPTLKPL